MNQIKFTKPVKTWGIVVLAGGLLYGFGVMSGGSGLATIGQLIWAVGMIGVGIVIYKQTKGQS